MSKIEPLSKTEVEQALASLPNWRIEHGRLHAEFTLANFVDAFAFMTKIAIVAEKMDHHPEWFNVYNRVSINLVTHDAGNVISQLDIALAKQIDSFLPAKSGS